MVSAKDPRGHAVRRETISAYLKGAGVEIWPPGRWSRERKAKAAIEVITGSDAAKPAIPVSRSKAGMLFLGSFVVQKERLTQKRLRLQAEPVGTKRIQARSLPDRTSGS